MTRTYSFGKETLKHVLDKLSIFKSQGQAKDYEIRIDGATVVARTSDLNNFFLFEKMLTQFSETVTVLFYQGKSRKYDTYDLKINNPLKLKSPSLATQEYIDKEVENKLEQEKRRFKWIHIKQQNKSLKKENKRLRTKVSELELKQTGEIREIISLISSQIPMFKKDSDLPSEINGVPLADLMEMMNDFRKKWGDDVFGRALSVCMVLGDEIELLEKVEGLIKTNADEKEK